MPGPDINDVIADGRLLRTVSRLILQEVKLLLDCNFLPDEAAEANLQLIREEIQVLEDQRARLRRRATRSQARVP
jgi:hypothetical protein